MTFAERMHQKLTVGLAPLVLNIVDVSHLHEGHAGAMPGGETHFNVEIVSTAFAGKSRVERQRMVYLLVQEELAERVHALSLRTLAPTEAEKTT